MCLPCVVFATFESTALSRLTAWVADESCGGESLEGSLGGIRGYSTPGCGVGDCSIHWFLFSVLFSVLKRKLLVGIMENLEHQYGKIWTATAHES